VFGIIYFLKVFANSMLRFKGSGFTVQGYLLERFTGSLRAAGPMGQRQGSTFRVQGYLVGINCIGGN